MAKRKRGSTRYQTRAAQQRELLNATAPLRVPHHAAMHLSHPNVEQTFPGVSLINCKVINCGVGILNDGAFLNLDGVDIIDCDTGILQKRGRIQGKNVRIRNRKGR
jgi:hypothetical protein